MTSLNDPARLGCGLAPSVYSETPNRCNACTDLADNHVDIQDVWGPVQDSVLVPRRAASNSCLGVENGFVTVTPLHVKPSCKSSDRSRRHPASAAAERITASQIPS